jgi:MoxR-like ATPase
MGPSFRGRRAGTPLDEVQPVMALEALGLLQDRIREVHVHPEVRRYIIHVVTATRAARLNGKPVGLNPTPSRLNGKPVGVNPTP